jgi:hypothetical protein
MKSILDRSFRYVPSASTDLRKTFARIRRGQNKAAAERNPAGMASRVKVVPIKQLKA